MKKSKTCFVLMPFHPISMPAIGISTLKAALNQKDYQCDVYYAAFDMFRFFRQSEDLKIELATYNHIARHRDLGDLFFSPTLTTNKSSEFIEQVLRKNLLNSSKRTKLPALDLIVKRIHHDSKLVEQFVDYCYNSRKWQQYDIVGFSSTFTQNVGSLALAEKIKANHPYIKILFGGANCADVMGIQLLKSFEQVDYVLQGEADISIAEFIDQFEQNKHPDDISGLIYRKGKEIFVHPYANLLNNIDNLPVPDYSDYFEQIPDPLKKLIEVSLPIELSRGCWWGEKKQCIFCGLNGTEKKYRSKSASRILDEISVQKALYQVSRFTAVDNILNKKYITELLPKLEKYNVRFFFETKSNLSEDNIIQFRKSGIVHIQPGIENLSSEILKLMNKGVKGFQNIQLLKWCTTHNIQPDWLYLYNFPNEPIEPYLREIKIFRHLSHLPPPMSPNPVVINRYSYLFENHRALGYTNVTPLKNSAAYYQNLSENERMNISYQFAGKPPQGNHPFYERLLWKEISLWKRNHTNGSRLYKFVGETMTLIFDSRNDNHDWYLMSDLAHYLYQFIKHAKTLEALYKMLDPIFSPDMRNTKIISDTLLKQRINRIKTIEILSLRYQNELRTFLSKLLESGLAIYIDNRYLALAVDCYSANEIEKCGFKV
ncbi:RiPP maturation radical SAM protein 1 [candidate division KSB1 bacterium]|nr:RiPP maturation radical SAM protein 1 [candidate division KSB1 bacterium]